MKLTREAMAYLLYGAPDAQRFNQDSAIMPDVWFAFAAEPDKAHDLLITPTFGVSPAQLWRTLRPTQKNKSCGNAAFNGSHVVMRLTFEDLVREVIPRTTWFAHRLAELPKSGRRPPLSRVFDILSGKKGAPKSPGLAWLARVIGCLAEKQAGSDPVNRSSLPNEKTCALKFLDLLQTDRLHATTPTEMIWRVQLNRPVQLALIDSVRTVKADVAHNAFGIDCSKIVWAVIDTGIDATHPAFAPDRVARTLDFTRLRDLFNGNDDQLVNELIELEAGRIGGLAFDWSRVEKGLSVDVNTSDSAPVNPHGTHVAGIIGANWPGEKPLVGMCPDIILWDLRVLTRNEKDELVGDEFNVISALQYIRYVNEKDNRIRVHGANVSLSIPHEIDTYACGCTPVCEEADRLVASGVVVVAAAGNEGWDKQHRAEGRFNAYSDISITDPGNAELVITVGSTHAVRPHSFGISYFSSRGPTGDGRLKPDLVAPGEKIVSTYPNGERHRLDGTSMAAPHVSGAAALVMARHTELKGKPVQVKKLLCDTATDLGRVRDFQGSGLLDVLRALQTY